MRPAHHHSVGLHSSQATGLDHVADAFTWLLGHDALAEALYPLLIHQMLQRLKGGKHRGKRLKPPGLIGSEL